MSENNSRIIIIIIILCHLLGRWLDMTRHSSLSSTFLVHSLEGRFIQSLMSPTYILRCLPLALLPLIFPPSISLNIMFWPVMWQKYWSFYFWIFVNKVGLTFGILTMLVLLSIQLIFPSRPNIHILHRVPRLFASTAMPRMTSER